MRAMWNDPNVTVPKDIAEKYNIDKKFYEKEKTEDNEYSDQTLLFLLYGTEN